MEDKNSNKMDVSYGVKKSEKSTQLSKQSKKGKKNTVQEAKGKEEPKPKKKTLIEEINEMKANNETGTSEFRDKMAKLEKVLGVDEINQFGTNELDIFEQNLKGMSYSDIKDLAYKIGINPFAPETQLKASLIREFKASNKNNMRNVMPTASECIKLDPNNPQHAKTIKILGDI